MKISKVLMLCAISFAFFNCSDSEEVVTKAQNVIGETDSSENSRAIINAPFGSGVNVQASYYNSGKNHIGYNLMNNYPKIKSVRIEIEPGKVSIATAKKWIQDAQNAGFQVIATYHVVGKLASNSVDDLNGATSWWKARYDDLGGDFIINIMNEWGGHSMSSATYGNAYDDAINKIRAIPNYGSRPIIIDLPGYGQGATVAGNAASYIDDNNYYFSVHIYRDAYNQGTNSPLSAADLDLLSNIHSKCIVGEFGYKTNVPNRVDVNNLVAWARGSGWPLFGWSWIHDGDDNMNMVKSNYNTAPNDKLVKETVNTTNPYSDNQPYFNSIYGMLPN